MPYTGRPGVDWGSVAQMLQLERQITDAQQQQKIQAMQWQGQQDYQTLVDSGIEPREALKRTAPKLFYSDPRGMAQAIAATMPSIAQPVGEPIVRQLEGGGRAMWTGTSYQIVPERAPGREQFVDVKTVGPTGETETRRITVEQREAELKEQELQSAATQYQAAQKELQSWKHPFGWGTAPIKEQMAGASNVLASAGIDPRTMQPFQTNVPPVSAAPAAQPTTQPTQPAAPSPNSDIPTAPANPANRTPNTLYRGLNNKLMIWTGKGWREPDQYEVMPRTLGISNTGIRG